MVGLMELPKLDEPTAWHHFCHWASECVQRWENQVCAATDEVTWKAAFESWQECAIRAIESLNALHTAPDANQWNALSAFYRVIFDMPSTTAGLAKVFELDDQRLLRQEKNIKKRFFRMSETNIGEYHILDMLVKQKILGWTDLDEILVFVNNAKVVNWPYLNMWAEVMPEYLKIIPYEGEEDVPEVFIPGIHSPLTAKYVLPLPGMSAGRRRIPVIDTDKPWSSGTPVWKERYHQVLQQFWEASGQSAPMSKVVPPDTLEEWGEFVCLHIREGNWKHESDFDRHACRNSDPNDYVSAIEEIISRGLKVVRLGHPGMTKLPEMKNVVDLAMDDGHDPALDVAAVANARFFMGPDSGPSSMAPAFGTPSLITDLFPWTRRPLLAGDLYCPRLVRAKWAYPGKDGWIPGDRILTAAEMFRPPWHDMPVSGPFDGFKCGWVPNTPDELADAAKEMLDGPGFDEKAALLQDKFDKCDAFDEYGFSSICSPSFLRKHAEELGL